MAAPQKTIGELIEARYTRREVLKLATGMGVLAATASLPGCLAPKQVAENKSLSSLTFQEIPKADLVSHRLAPGYELQLLARWGDRLLHGAPQFNPHKQTPEAQAKQFGQNADFTAYLPFAYGSQDSDHGLLHINHEHTLAWLMFPGLTEKISIENVTHQQTDIEKAAQGFSLCEVRRNSQGRWQVILGSPFNRRVSALTDMPISGPAAGHPRLKTKVDPTGRRVKGTFGNCAGGVTPWGTVLSAEENFHDYFHGTAKDGPEARNHKRQDIGGYLRYGWHRFDPRFDIAKEPNEPNRFGWIVEYDPYDPSSPPVKRSALGRIKHESASCAITADGRLAVYSGDDAEFEYIYRFVSSRPVDFENRAANRDLLDDGVLSVARFHADGSLEWLPLIYGQGPLTAQNDFHSLADVLIETRRAADLLGATKMDRPEDIDIHPSTGTVYCVMTKNPNRKPDQVDAANPRAHNKHGHILTFTPPEKNGKADHGADLFRWDMFIEAGNPANAADGAHYPGPVSEFGWLSDPDNLAFDAKGRLWITSDGQPQSIGVCDGLYATDTSGPGRGITRHFFSGPRGSELTGPSFTPDGKTLFVSIQHPGENSTFDTPSTRWPDFNANMPPRAAVVAIVKDDGGEIGS